MNTFTIRNIPQPVERYLRRLARENHKSLNKTAIDLFTQAAGLVPEEKKSRKHRDTKSVIHPWVTDEYNDFKKNTGIFDTIDDEIWHP